MVMFGWPDVETESAEERDWLINVLAVAAVAKLSRDHVLPMTSNAGFSVGDDVDGVFVDFDSYTCLLLRLGVLDARLCNDRRDGHLAYLERSKSTLACQAFCATSDLSGSAARICIHPLSTFSSLLKLDNTSARSKRLTLAYRHT